MQNYFVILLESQMELFSEFGHLTKNDKDELLISINDQKLAIFFIK